MACHKQCDDTVCTTAYFDFSLFVCSESAGIRDVLISLLFCLHLDTVPKGPLASRDAAK